MRENNAVVHHDVIKHSQVPVNGQFETTFIRVVSDLDVFGSHSFVSKISTKLTGSTWHHSKIPFHLSQSVGR